MRHTAFIAVSLTLLLLAGTIATPARAQLLAPAPEPATSAPAPASTASEPAAEPQIAPADQKRVDAIHQFQKDVVNVAALRADPDYLLGAALLTRPFKNQIAALSFNALSARASGAPGAGPATWWLRLGLCSDKSDCPNAEAYKHLQQDAAGNAAVWLVALDLAAADKDSKAELAALTKAAAATAYDDYYGKALAGTTTALQVLPPLADTMEGAHDGQPDNPAGVRVLVAITGTGNYPRPNLDPVLQLCDPQADGMDAARKAGCLKLAHTLQWGSSPVARAAGLHLQGTLEPDAKGQADEATRNLAWQIQQYSALLQHALVDPTLAAQWLANASHGGTELSLILATLRDNHVPTEAPATFQPAAAGGSNP
jgi:hypothetical protein